MSRAAVHGHFPFGRPNAERPMRRPPGAVDVLVLGVHPSAFHVRWWPPPHVDRRPAVERSRPLIGSLAVDVEPVVFWDGSDPTRGEQLARWMEDVGFHGAWGAVEVGHNAPSGTALRDQYLAHLDAAPERVAYTDLVPWYLVKDGKGSQGEAMRERYDPLAAELGLPPATIPKRPSARGMVDIACSDQRRHTLREELHLANPSVIVTLGQEALDGLVAFAESSEGVPRRLLPDESYGLDAHVTIDGAQYRVIPLVHPGLLRRSPPGSPWHTCHERWQYQVRRRASP